MNFMDCIKGAKLPAYIERQLQEDYDLLLKESGDPGVASSRLAETFEKRSASQAKAKIKGALKAQEVQKEVADQLGWMQEEFDRMGPKGQWMAKLLGHTPTEDRAISKVYSRAAQSGNREVIDTLSMLEQFHEKVAAKGLSLRHDKGLMSKITQGLIDGADSIADAEVRGLVKEMKGVMDAALKAYRAQGGVIGEIDGYFPLKHNREKIIAGGWENWWPAWREMNDLEKMTDFSTGRPLTPERFEEISRDVFENIRTDGAHRKAQQLESGDTKARRPGELFARRMQARMSRPKNSQAYKKYNEKFGTGEESEYDLILANLREMAHDTGVMKVLGPTPKSVNETLMAYAGSKGNPIAKQKRIDALFRTMIGHWDGSADTLLAKGVTGAQHLMDAALLGSASIAAVGDGMFVAQTLRMAGLSGQGGAAVDGFLKGIAGNTDDITRAIHTSEAFMHTQVSRYMDGPSPTTGGRVRTTLNDMKNLNHRLSGLQNITLGTGDSLSLGLASGLGETVGKKTPWAELPGDFRQLLQENAISEGDWKRLLKNGTDDRGFVTRNGLPDELADVSDKIGNLELQLRMWATNSPDLTTRMYSTGNVLGARTRGDAGHLAMSSLMQFKSFPIQVYRNHLVPALIKGANGELSDITMLTANGIIIGSMVVQLKELLKGNPPMAADDPALYMKGLWQSGVGGIWGDIFFKDPDAYKRNIFGELAGPVAGVTGDTALTVMSSIKAAFLEDEEIDARALVRAGRTVVPFGTLWYGKLAFERTVIDLLNTTVDDGYHDYINTRNKKMIEERGSAGWMPQGAVYE